MDSKGAVENKEPWPKDNRREAETGSAQIPRVLTTSCDMYLDNHVGSKEPFCNTRMPREAIGQA